MRRSGKARGWTVDSVAKYAATAVAGVEAAARAEDETDGNADEDVDEDKAEALPPPPRQSCRAAFSHANES